MTGISSSGSSSAPAGLLSCPNCFCDLSGGSRSTDVRSSNLTLSGKKNISFVFFTNSEKAEKTAAPTASVFQQAAAIGAGQLMTFLAMDIDYEIYMYILPGPGRI